MRKIKGKIKVVLENRLKSLNDDQADMVANFCTAIKRRMSKIYSRFSVGVPFLRCLDFIIVRCNGNRFIEFELSNICNARCIFCPYPDMLRTDKKFMHMSAETLAATQRTLRNFKGTLVSFTPTTGDTLLHPEWADYISSVLELENVGRATLFTNAIEFGEEAIDRFIRLLKNDRKGKFSQIYFSLGGYDKESYKRLYQVDRFDKVRSNIHNLLNRLKMEKIALGVHFHVKLEKDTEASVEKALQTYNEDQYPFVYVSHSKAYFSNDAYKRNALIDYLEEQNSDKHLACAYLYKTRFAADGSVWADGCVISEMPGDSSLKLGGLDEDWQSLQSKREDLVRRWEQDRVIPKPCQGCTMYRCRK